MSFEFFCATDTGRARNNNEDSVAVDEAPALIVLADDLGGGLEPVLDSGGKNNHSVFASAFIDALTENRSRKRVPGVMPVSTVLD